MHVCVCVCVRKGHFKNITARAYYGLNKLSFHLAYNILHSRYKTEHRKHIVSPLINTIIIITTKFSLKDTNIASI